MSEALNEAGHKTAWAYTSKEAQELLCKQSWDIAIVDLNLPDCNGTNFTETIISNAKQNGYHLIVIGITGDMSANSKTAFLQAGATACLTKPFSIDELIGLIESHKL
jgi:DNA-binding response OmpR family regulator